MFGNNWKKAYDGLLEQFQKEQDKYFNLLNKLEHLKLCKSCNSKLSNITSKAL